MIHGNAQSMREWKNIICKEEKYSVEDSLIFCHVFDSLNSIYGVIKIFSSSRAKINHYVPLYIGRKGMLIFSDTGVTSTLSLWLKEISHAYQFSTLPLRYTCKATKESMTTLFRTVFQNKRFRNNPNVRMTFLDIYNLSCIDKKSFEYEAHSVLEVGFILYLKYRLHQGFPKK